MSTVKKSPTSDKLKENDCRTDVKFLSDRLLNAIQASVIFVDTDGKIYCTNQQARQDLKTDKSIEGTILSDLLSIEYRNVNILPELVSRFDNVNTEQVILPQGSFISTKDNRVAFLATGVICRLDYGRLLFSFHNIVEEMTHEYMIKMALSSTKIFPWFYDFDRGAMVIDQRYFDYTGIPTRDNTMTLEAFSERLHPDDRSAMSHAFMLQLNGEHYPYSIPYRLRRGDDTYEWFEGQSTYLGQIKGMPYRIVGICMSTQTHKDIEEALTEAKNKAEQSDKLKSAFLANMSHEIRTPLNAIVGFSDLLTGGAVAPDSNDAKEYSALIAKNCDHLLSLVSDILDLSRIETGAMEYKLAEHSLNQFLTDIYQNQRYLMPDQVAFHLLLPLQQVKITTDSMRLRQVIEHLIGNAIKFTTNGHIDLGFTLSENGNSVRLFVSDTGCGIPANQTEKIFDRFYKVDSFMQGAGLGLSICKIISERLGGTISVSSTMKKGSRFTIKLPLNFQENTNSIKI